MPTQQIANAELSDHEQRWQKDSKSHTFGGSAQAVEVPLKIMVMLIYCFLHVL